MVHALNADARRGNATLGATGDMVKSYFQHTRVIRGIFAIVMKLTSPLGGKRQVGAPETAAKSVTPCFYLRLGTTSGWIHVHILLSTTLTRNLNLM